MKKSFKLYRIVLGLLIAAGLFSSCTDDMMDRINENPNDPKDVPAKFILAELIASTATSVAGGDLSLYASVYMELEAGTHNQLFSAEKRLGDVTSSTTYNNSWGAIYVNIRNAKKILEKCSENGTEALNVKTRGVARVLLAYNLAVLSDIFGDAPYSQSGIYDEFGMPVYMQPKVDKQEDNYKEILNQLEEAIKDLDGKDEAVTGDCKSHDLLYSGNGASWKKFAYGLKARYTLRLLARMSDTERATAYDYITDCVDNSFASEDEQANFDVYNGVETSNPRTVFYDSRGAIGLSKSFISLIESRGDARHKTFADASSWGQESLENLKKSAAENGNPEEVQYAYPFSIICQAIEAPVALLSFHELMFIKAEALARKGGQDTKAIAAMKEGVQASLNYCNVILEAGANYGVGISENLTADDYNAIATSIDQRIAAGSPLLKEIMTEKYIACQAPAGESLEAYADYRRCKAMNENFISLQNPLKFPLRFTYGADDVTANQNVSVLYGDGTYVYSEPVWWAGGTR